MGHTNIYNVAGHNFALHFEEGDTLQELLAQYAPFSADSPVGDGLLFSIEVKEGIPAGGYSFQEEMCQEEEGAGIRVGRVQEKPAFEFAFAGESCALLVCDDERFARGTLHTWNDRLSGFNSALMVMYALASAWQDTLLLHASVVVKSGKGHLFLGHSGTGKSTHSRLWLRHLEEVRLLNDDNPILRVTTDGIPFVYGSPWSGKTSCYVNEGYPVGSIVRLSQAPHNRIRRLSPIEGYAALRPAVSGMRWHREVADGQHRTESEVVRRVGIWHLECLPDAEAARCCSVAVAPEEEVLAGENVMNNKTVVFDEVRRLTQSGSRVVLAVKGMSMLPFIVGERESVVLAATPSTLRVGDIVAAYVDGCKHVIHRVVEVDGDRLKLMGDGNLSLREHCRREDVIAQAVAVVTRNGKERPLTGKLWKWRVWQALLPIRRYLLAVYKKVYYNKINQLS